MKYKLKDLKAYPWGCDLRLDVKSKAMVVEDILSNKEENQEDIIKKYSKELNYKSSTIKLWIKTFKNTHKSYIKCLDGTILMSPDIVNGPSINFTRSELAKLRAKANKLIKNAKCNPYGTGPTRNMKQSANLFTED